jgi:catechol 2,3-dioxygenase-like lactoylglutathione lyase family enzyme
MVDVLDIKAFLPSKDFAVSRDFYSQLGFTENWANDNLAEFEFSGRKFLLQKFYEQAFAENLMIQLMVPDAEAWWAKAESGGLIDSFGIRAKPPELQPWGQKVLYLWDPAGVLWHIAEPMS